MRKIRFFYMTVFSLLLFLMSFSATYFVDLDRPDDTGNGLSWGAARKTLSGVLAVAVSGDQIFVKEGTYNEGILSVIPGVELYGGFTGIETSLVERNYILHPTIINASMAPEGFVSMEGVLDGFSVTNAGIVAVRNQSTSGVIQNCRIYGNSMASPGDFGMGTVIVNGVMSNCLIYQNSSLYEAVSLYSGVVSCCTIADNAGFGIAQNTGSILENCIVSGNGISAITNLLGSTGMSVFYSLFSDPDPSLFTGPGNIFLAPAVFVNPIADQDADYRLVLGSPGIDVGSSGFITTDYYGLTRPYTNGFDMGACEYNEPPSVAITTTSPIQVAHNAMQFTLEGTYADPETAMQFLSFTVNGGTSLNVDVTGSPWSQDLTVTGTAQVQVTGYDEGYAPSAVVSDTFVVQAVLPSCVIVTPSGDVSIPYSKSSIDVAVYANDDNSVSEILYRLGTSGDWSSSSDYADSYWHFTVNNLQAGAQTLYVKAKDADGYESAGDTLLITRKDHPIYIDIDNISGTEDGLTWATAYSNITDALTAFSGQGYDFWVADGTYQEGSAVSVASSTDILYGGFTGVESALDQRDFETNRTIIDGEGTYRCIEIYGKVDGFDIANGSLSTFGEGAGAYMYSGSTLINSRIFSNSISDSGFGGGISFFEATISHCKIYDNSAGLNGTGGGLYGGNGEISFCEVYGNSAYVGGGIIGEGLTVYNCSVYRNTAAIAGGAYFSIAAEPVLSCLFFDNTASSDVGGVYLEHTIISASTIYGNFSSDTTGGLHSTLNSTANSCIIYGNTDSSGVSNVSSEPTSAFLYCCSTDFDSATTLTGSITVDPLFASTSGDSSTWDLSLQDSSPCINAGDPTGDFTGQLDIANRDRVIGRVEMGAYEMNCAPTVTISDPASSPLIVAFNVVSYDVQGSAADLDGNLDGIDYRMNGGAWSSQLVTNTFSVAIPLSVGNTVFDARSRDKGGFYFPVLSSEIESVTITRSANQAPSVSITSPVSNITVDQSVGAYLIEGTAFDSDGNISALEYRVNGSGWSDLTIETNWSMNAFLLPGDNLFEVRALDNAASFGGTDTWSNIASVTVTRQVDQIYINQASTALTPDGYSWANAYPTISEALTHASECSTFWVASGTYQEGATITIADTVNIYGCFAGTETMLSERDIQANRTILDGENSYLPVINYGLFNGFDVINGQNTNSGGGMINEASGTVAQCRIYDNQSSAGAGGVDNEGNIVNGLIYNNVGQTVGGVQNAGSIVNSTIYGNDGSNPGGLLNQGDVMNTIIWGNTSSGNPSDVGNTGSITFSCYYESDGTGYSISEDPLFVDPENDLFSLRDASPCISGGTQTDGILTAPACDIIGLERPYGAYEMGAYEMNTAPIAEFTDPVADIEVPFSTNSYSLTGSYYDIEGEVQSVEYSYNNGAFVSANMDTGSETFTFASNLVAGTNTFHVCAQDMGSMDGFTDRTGPEDTVTITRLDNILPTGEITSPSETGIVVSSDTTSITISGTASDADGSISRVYVNYKYGTISAPGSETWSAQVPLYDGRNEITVWIDDNASDYGGQTGRTELGPIVVLREQNSTPVVNINDPADSWKIVDSAVSQYTFSGTAADSSGSISSVFANVGGSLITDVTGLDDWSFMANLNPGANACVVSATSTTGMIGNARCTVFRPASRMYVDVDSVAPMPDGLSWATAFPSLEYALSVKSVDQEFWVAEGVYLLTDTLTVTSDLALLGGFSGVETSIDERNPAAHPTILDGQNAVLCVNNAGLLDGFHVRNGLNATTYQGGGIYNTGTVRNCEVYQNVTEETQDSGEIKGGAGVFNYSAGIVEYSKIYSNTVYHRGAGIRNYGTVRYCEIYDNECLRIPAFGAGIYNAGICHDSKIYNNRNQVSGGGCYNSNGDLYNNEIFGNQSAYAAGIHLIGGSLENCLIYNNSASHYGSAVVMGDSYTTIKHCTIYHNSDTVGAVYGKGSILSSILWNNQGGAIKEDENGTIYTYGCCYHDPDFDNGDESDISSDPLFVNVSGDPSTWDLSLQDQSPCVDAGYLWTDYPVTDLNGNDRPGADGFCCIGAIESPDNYTPGPLSTPVDPIHLYVDEAGDDSDGSSWEHAFTDLEDALQYAWDSNSPQIEIWVGLQSYTLSNTLKVSRLVKLYGGFTGTESSLDERDLESNKTLIDADDQFRCAVNGGILEGFALTGGFLSVPVDPTVYDFYFLYGSGLNNMGTASHCEVYNCAAFGDDYGAAFYNGNIATDMVVRDNTSEYSVGGVYNKMMNGISELDRAKIYSNSSVEGVGGLFNAGQAENLLIYNNSSTNSNGAVYNQYYLMYATIYNNTSADSVAAVSVGPLLTNSIIWGHTLNVDSETFINYSCFPESTGINSCLSLDPEFVNITGDSSTWDLSLQNTSPCIDMANPQYTISTLDLEGVLRPVGAGYDMGAYEYNEIPEIFFSDPNTNQTVAFNVLTYDFSGTATDSDGTISEVQYRKDSGSWVTATGTDSWSFTASLDQGDNIFEVRAKDSNLSYSIPSSVTITRSANVKPTAIILSDTSAQSFGFTTTTFGINGTAADSDGSVTLVRYRNNGGPWMNGTGTDTWSINADLQVGDNNFVVQVVDNARDYGSLTNGLTSYALETMTRAANTAPELNVVTSSQTVDFSHMSLNVTGTVTDTDCGLRTFEYQVNGAGWNTLTPTGDDWSYDLTLAQGDNIFEVRAIDRGADYGESDLTTSRSITITRSGNVGPEGSISAPVQDETVPFTSTSFGFNGTTFDIDGNVSVVEYRNNGGNWMSATGTDNWGFSAALVTGTNSIIVRAADNATDYGAAENGFNTFGGYTITRTANVAPELQVVSTTQTVDFSHASLTVTGTVTDTDCGLRTLEYQVNSGGWNALTPTGDDWSYDLTLDEGDTTFEVRATDCGADYGDQDLSSSQSITITRSANEAPMGSIIAPTQDATVPFTTIISAFNGTAADSDGSVSAVEYRNNGGSWMAATGTEAWNFSAALQIGSNSIEVRATDNAATYGAAENAFTSLGGYTITRTSNVAPELQVVTTTQTVDFSHMSLTVTGTVTDTDCGLRSFEYQVNSGGWNALTPTGDDWSYDLTLAEGDNVFEVRATDCGADYGDQDLSSSQSITITRSANEAPTGNITAPTQDATLPFVTMTSDFNGTAADRDGSVSAVEYRNNGGSWMTATGTEAWNFSAALQVGSNSIEVRATDNASDYGAAENAFTSLGGYTITRTANVAPELQVVTTTQTVDFSHMSLTVTGTVTDTDCGLRTLEYQVNGAGWNGFIPTGDNWSYDLTLAEGDNVFEVRATDCGADYGESDLSTSQSITITRSPNVLPTGQITDPAAAMIYVDFNQMDYLVTGTAGDEDGSVSEVQYQINSGGWFVASGTTQWQMTAPLVANITNTITVRAYDNASDYGAAENGETYLGTAMIWRNANAAPMFSVTQPTQSTVDVDFDETTFDFSGIAGDTDGTVRAVEYRQNSGSWMNATGTDSWNFQVNLNVGANQIDVRAMDNAADFGGTDTPSEIASYTITRAENGAPIVTIEAPLTDGYVRFDETPQLFSGTASDEDGTISSVQYRNNGGSWISATGTDNWSFSFDLEIGENAIEVRALDDQNLPSAMKSRTFTRLNELIADFTVDVTSAEEDTLIHFNDASTGDLETWSWDFDNDGTIDSIEANPTWIYEDAGLYTVSLTVTDLLSEITETKTGLISIYPMDAEDYDSALMADTIPTMMSQGETYYVELTLKNTGRETWMDDQMIYLGAVDNSDPLATSRFLRVDIFGDVRYGEEVTFRIEMKPTQPGVHTTDWQMIYEDNFWFGDVVEEDVYVEQKTAVEQNNWIIYQ